MKGRAILTAEKSRQPGQRTLETRRIRYAPLLLSSMRASSTHGCWFQIIAEAATHVAVSRHGAGKGVETSMFTHAWFRRVFRLPSVVAVVSVYSHDDVVAVPQAEAQLRRTFGAVLAKTGSGFAFGSPCSVGDILFLEEVTARGGEIWLVLPVNQDVLEAHLRERFTKLAHAAMLTPSAGEGRSRTQSWRNASSAGHGAGMRAWAGDLDEPLQPTAGGLAGRGAGVADPRGQSPHSFGNARARAHSRSSLTTDLDSPTFVSDTVELWIGRLRALVACATKVDVSNSMSPEFSSANMHYCGMVLYGLAVMKAEKLGVPLERVLLKVCLPPALAMAGWVAHPRCWCRYGATGGAQWAGGWRGYTHGPQLLTRLPRVAQLAHLCARGIEASRCPTRPCAPAAGCGHKSTEIRGRRVRSV